MPTAEQGGTGGGRGVSFWLKLLAPVLASIAGLVALRLLGPDILTQERLSGILRPLGAWAPLAFVFFLAIRPITLLPGQVFTAVGGIMFGTLMGSVYAMVGSTLAMMLIQVLAKRFGSRLMRRFAKGKYESIREVAKQNDFKFALLTTINPLVPTDVAVAAASASGARFWPTTLGVLLGTLPGTFLTAQFGSALGQGKTILTIVSALGMIVSLVLGLMLGKKLFVQIRDAPTDEEVRARRGFFGQGRTAPFPSPAAGTPGL